MSYKDEMQSMFGPTEEEALQMAGKDLKLGRDYRPASVFSPIQPLTTRHTYWANGEWRINFNGTEYSGFAWIDRLAAFENLGLEPSEIQRKYDNCVQFYFKLNAMGGISLAEVQEYAKAKKEGRLLILPEGSNASVYDLSKPMQRISIPAKFTITQDETMMQFGDAAVNAYLSHLVLYTCPLCGKTAQIHRCLTPGAFVAECSYCDKIVSIDLNQPKQE